MIEYVNRDIFFLFFCKILILFLAIPFFSYSQDNNMGSLNYLNTSNGFGNIYLGEDISLIPPNKLAFMDNDSIPDIDGCIKYEYGDLDQINNKSNLNLDLVGIRVYKHKIINIYLFFKKEFGFRVFQSFEASYGGCTERIRDFTYSWETDNVKLYLEYDKEDLGIAIFSCKKLYQEVDRNNSKRLAAQ